MIGSLILNNCYKCIINDILIVQHGRHIVKQSIKLFESGDAKAQTKVIWVELIYGTSYPKITSNYGRLKCNKSVESGLKTVSWHCAFLQFATLLPSMDMIMKLGFQYVYNCFPLPDVPLTQALFPSLSPLPFLHNRINPYGKKMILGVCLCLQYICLK